MKRVSSKTYIFKKIFFESCSVKRIRTREFLDKLRSHEFATEEDLSEALAAWTYATWTKNVALAIHIRIEGEPSIRQLSLQYRLREGMEYRHIVEEYDYDRPVSLPKWYINALEKIKNPSIPNRNCAGYRSS
jgi:hypothetical protein